VWRQHLSRTRRCWSCPSRLPVRVGIMRRVRRRHRRAPVSGAISGRDCLEPKGFARSWYRRYGRARAHRQASGAGEARRSERSARAISGRYRRYGRAHAHRQASGAGKARRSERAGIPRLKTCFTLLGCAKPGAIAGETLSIYTRSAPIMIIMIVVMALASHGTIGAAAAQGGTAIVAYCVDQRSGGCDFRPHRQDAFASPCSDQGRDDG
jgi:hypothetical protein